MRRSKPIQTRRVHLGPFLAALVCLLPASTALAQPAPRIPAVVKHDANSKRGNLTFRKALADPAMLTDQANRQAFDAYVHSYLLSRLVMVENVTQLPELRDSIKRELKSGPKGTAHERYNVIALDVLTKILAGSYVPVVPKHAAIIRYNAVVMIGDLNQEEEVKRGPAVVARAVPYAPALDDMLKWVGNARVPDYMKAAVLRGLLRHAQAGIAGKRAAATQTEMLKLLNEKAPPAARSAKVHAWMRRRAADVLGAMKSAGSGNRVGMALLSVMRDDADPILVRGTAAAALSQVLTAEQLKTLQPEIKKVQDQANAVGTTVAAPKTPAAAKPSVKAASPVPMP